MPLRSALAHDASPRPLCSPTIRQCQRFSKSIQPDRSTAQGTSPITGQHHRLACRPAATAASRQPDSPAQAAVAVVQPVGAAFIAWDLDNIPVQHAAHLPLVARRLVAAVERHCLVAGQQQQQQPSYPPTQLTAYANERTLARFSGRGGRSGADAAARALALVGGRLVPVKTRRWVRLLQPFRMQGGI